MLRIGMQFADSGKATNIGGFHHSEDPPRGPIMHSGGGGGGGGRWRQEQWVWPLPPPGPLTFVCEWPAAGVPLTREQTDAQAILEASARARVIFRDQGAETGGSRSSVTHFAPAPQPGTE